MGRRIVVQLVSEIDIRSSAGRVDVQELEKGLEKCVLRIDRDCRICEREGSQYARRARQRTKKKLTEIAIEFEFVERLSSS